MSEHELWNELGNLYLLTGSYAQAIRAYTRSIALDRNAGSPYSSMAMAYVRQGRYGEAISLYQRGIELLKDDQERAASWSQLGDVYRLLKEYSLATQAYRQADELSFGLSPVAPDNLQPEDAPAIAPLEPESLQAAPDVQAAVVIIEEELLPVEDPAPAPSAPAELVPLASEFAIDSGEIEDSLPEPTPDSGVESIQVVESASEPTPEPVTEPGGVVEGVPLYEELTPWWFDNQVSPEAAPDLTVEDPWFEVLDPELGADYPALEPAPCAPASMVDAAALAGVSSEVEPEPAPQELPQLVVLTPDVDIVTPAPEFVAETVTDLEAIRYVPAELPVVELTGEERANLQTGIERNRRLLEQNPRNALAWDTLGGQYKALGQYEDALNAYQRAVSLDGSKAVFLHHLGLVFAALERYDDAIAMFERVIEIDPQHGLAHATLGGYYRKKGMEERAQEHIAKARSLVPQDENEYNRACMEAICGNSDGALSLLEIALKNKQSYVNWARRDPDLDFIRNDPRLQSLLAEYATKPAQ